MNKKTKFVYLVYCNPDKPLVYGIYESKKKAVEYAYYLIKYRKELAIKHNWSFNFYHYEDYSKEKQKKISIDHPEWREKTIFSTCLNIKDKDGKPAPYCDGCYIQVVRRPITK